jgi:lysophospholipase L1-like esterase
VNGGTAGGGGGTGGGGGAADVVALGVRWLGRADTSSPARVRFAWPGSGFEARFSGTALAVELAVSDRLVFLPIVDGQPRAVFTAMPGGRTQDVATSLPPGLHTVALLRETEGQEGTSEITKITVAGGSLATPPASTARFFELYGDSISCGYGNLGADPTCGFSVDTESHYQSYGAVAARALGAEVSTIAVSGRGVYRNFDGSTSNPLPQLHDRALTSPASPRWNGRKPAAIVLNLGTNDFAEGDPGAAFDNAYDAFVQTLRSENPDAQLLCAVGPMLTGSALSHLNATVDAIVDDRRRGGDTRIDKLVLTTQMDGEMGCDYHPNVTKHASMGAVLASALRDKMGW